MTFLVLAMVTILIFGLIVAKNLRRQRALKPLKTVASDQPILYRVPVTAKPTLFSGWGKMVGDMEVVVRPGSIAVSMIPLKLGESLGTDWFFIAQDTAIEVSREPSAVGNRRQWILMTAKEQGEEVRLAISSHNQLGDVWRALIDAGARAQSHPPSET